MIIQNDSQTTYEFPDLGKIVAPGETIELPDTIRWTNWDGGEDHGKEFEMDHPVPDGFSRVDTPADPPKRAKQAKEQASSEEATTEADASAEQS